MSKARIIKKYAIVHQTLVRNLVIFLYIFGFTINQFQIVPFIGYSTAYVVLVISFTLSFFCLIAASVIGPGEVPKDWVIGK